jgi:hypothetical protein
MVPTVPTAPRLLLAAVALSGCIPQQPPKDLSETDRVVLVSDHVAASPTVARGYASLLVHNDDGLFPAFAGKDFESRKRARVLRFDRGGEGFAELAAGGEAGFCTCKGSGCAGKEPCVDAQAWDGTAVVVQLGVNDAFSTFFELISNEPLRKDPTPAIDRFRSDVRAVLAKVVDPKTLARPPRVFATNLPDPSDGEGDLARLVKASFPVAGLNFDAMTPALVRQVLDGFNQVIAEECAAAGVTVIDAHGHFLGHGYHSAEPSGQSYHPEDPTRWYSSLMGPNLRGAHELRRLIWRAMAGEDVAEIPQNLPADSNLDLPEVPEAGWANAVVGAKISRTITLGTTEYPNLGADLKKILGPPVGGTAEAVSIGVAGDYVVVDLGEGEEAFDGDGPDLVVLEYGLKSGGVPERYRVLAANAPAGPFVEIADGAGEQAFDLAGSGLEKARYLRIESMVRLVDIANGMGSPFYPGPEFDAVGAVHPGHP